MRGVTGTLEGTAVEPLPFVREWAALVTHHVEHAEPIMDSGTPALPPTIRGKALKKGKIRDSLHLALSDDEYLKSGLANPVLLSHRMALNHTFSRLARMGIPPRDRFVLCHLAATTIEDVYAVSAIEFVRQSVAEQPENRADQATTESFRGRG
jgi:hypothetical protein